MNIVEEAIQLIKLERSVDEIEAAGNDPLLNEEVTRELDQIEKEGQSKAAASHAHRYAKKFQDFLYGEGVKRRIEDCNDVIDVSRLFQHNR